MEGILSFKPADLLLFAGGILIVGIITLMIDVWSTVMLESSTILQRTNRP